MAKVSLRIYNREIERLVEQGHIDEAIAHCRHILRTFPKHLETYRLLGKAYLEAKRYNEAVDIFGRVLMAVPGDFVAHVGLSIISDEENKQDDAIWHMERAFEAQPSNAAIQGELQRLYGRRDGMEPPKIRMTRGALAHMYVQGELYPQAISEIRAVLAEDSQRADMQILLAYSYFKAGQKSDASDICDQLLKRYPYCFDANRIKVELLPATAGAESTQVYRMHVGELDPYANFVKGSIFQTSDVSDASVNLERLEYTGEEVPAGQEWSASLGISAASGLASSSFDEQPDWLKSGGFSEQTPSPQSAPAPDSASESQDSIPDFLRAAGWGESNTPEQPTSIFDEEPAGEPLVAADLPDWLKAQAPQLDNLNPITQPIPDVTMQSADTPDWLSGLGGEETPAESQAESAPSGDVPDWLSGLGGVASSAISTSQPESTPPSDVPDWLSGLDRTEKSDEPADAPDWLGGVSEKAQPESQPEAQPADIPDWLRGAEPKTESAASVESLGASAQEQDDAVAWLESLAAKHGAKPEELVTDPNKRSETPPDWVSQAQSINQQPAAPQPNVQDLGASAQEQDDAVAWLESLAAKHGAKPEELVTDPNKRSETPPEWVSQAQSINQQPAAPQPNVQDLGASAQEQDDAVAWLESLAAKHGAKPEELVTDPNKRSETPPEWVQQAQSIGEAQSASEEPAQKSEWVEGAQNIGEQFFAEFENASKPEPAMDETGMWIRDLDEKETQEGEPLQRGDIPEWLSDAQPPADSGEKFDLPEQKEAADLPNWLSGIDEDKGEAPSVESGDYISQNLSNQDLSDWLSGLDDEPGLNIDPELLRAPSRPPLAQPEKPLEAQPAKSDLPDWLSDVDSESEAEDDAWKESVQPAASTSTDEAAPVTLTVDLPDWLKGVDEEVEEADEAGEDAPPWQHREQWEAETPQLLKPTSPSDWHPVEPKPVPVQKQEPAVQPQQPVSVPPPQPRAQSIMQNPPSPEPGEKAAVAKKKPVRTVRQPKAEGQSNVNVLGQAKGELDRGNIPTALDHYGKLIKKGRHLEETIRDLTESIYRYPVEVGIWQTLGDAYMRANRLKEALEAYNKAEELIR
ncbi:MAG: tetratricopeptide repeat protein [Chloroflexi bacterium]|nr:tetratricopeptide repeat protein [Chloroflexota bacterium]